MNIKLPERAAARYSDLRVIAQGGMGVVLSAQDLMTGYEVAIKVVHPEHRDDREVLKRLAREVEALKQLHHPGVVRLLRFIFREARELEIPTTVCGEIAGDWHYTRLLLALGLQEFSMHPGRLLEVKKIVRETDIPRAKAALSQWFNSVADPAAPSLLQMIDESQRGH